MLSRGIQALLRNISYQLLEKAFTLKELRYAIPITKMRTSPVWLKCTLVSGCK